MLMLVCILMTMSVCVRCMRMTAAVVMVGPALGLEGSVFASRCEPQSADHIVEYMIGLVAQPTRLDLQRNMPVAEVITGARQ